MHSARFYKTAAGSEIVKDWIRKFTREDQRVLGRDLLRLQIGFPMGLPLCRSLGGGLWELRSTLSGPVEARMIFYFEAELQALVVLNGFIKKSQKTPKSEIDIALRRKRDLES